MTVFSNVLSAVEKACFVAFGGFWVEISLVTNPNKAEVLVGL